VHGPQGSATIATIAGIAHLRMHELPPDVEPLLETTVTYQPSVSTGVYSYATHGAVVAVDPETGAIDLLDFAVAEDCGTMVNPMLVEGQIRGGVVQGIGTALHEQIPYDAHGQPLAATLLDYHLPGAHEVPPIKIGHLHVPATATEYGMKGMGEGGWSPYHSDAAEDTCRDPEGRRPTYIRPQRLPVIAIVSRNSPFESDRPRDQGAWWKAVEMPRIGL
jgi:carbon-monoxide dehydrogenase large subunit